MSKRIPNSRLESPAAPKRSRRTKKSAAVEEAGLGSSPQFHLFLDLPEDAQSEIIDRAIFPDPDNALHLPHEQIGIGLLGPLLRVSKGVHALARRRLRVLLRSVMKRDLESINPGVFANEPVPLAFMLKIRQTPDDVCPYTACLLRCCGARITDLAVLFGDMLTGLENLHVVDTLHQPFVLKLGPVEHSERRPQRLVLLRHFLGVDNSPRLVFRYLGLDSLFHLDLLCPPVNYRPVTLWKILMLLAKHIFRLYELGHRVTERARLFVIRIQKAYLDLFDMMIGAWYRTQDFNISPRFRPTVFLHTCATLLLPSEIRSRQYPFLVGSISDGLYEPIRFHDSLYIRLGQMTRDGLTLSMPDGYFLDQRKQRFCDGRLLAGSANPTAYWDQSSPVAIAEQTFCFNGARVGWSEIEFVDASFVAASLFPAYYFPIQGPASQRFDYARNGFALATLFYPNSIDFRLECYEPRLPQEVQTRLRTFAREHAYVAPRTGSQVLEILATKLAQMPMSFLSHFFSHKTLGRGVANGVSDVLYRATAHVLRNETNCSEGLGYLVRYAKSGRLLNWEKFLTCYYHSAPDAQTPPLLTPYEFRMELLDCGLSVKSLVEFDTLWWRLPTTGAHAPLLDPHSKASFHQESTSPTALEKFVIHVASAPIPVWSHSYRPLSRQLGRYENALAHALLRSTSAAGTTTTSSQLPSLRPRSILTACCNLLAFKDHVPDQKKASKERGEDSGSSRARAMALLLTRAEIELAARNLLAAAGPAADDLDEWVTYLFDLFEGRAHVCGKRIPLDMWRWLVCALNRTVFAHFMPEAIFGPTAVPLLASLPLDFQERMYELSLALGWTEDDVAAYEHRLARAGLRVVPDEREENGSEMDFAVQ